MKLRILLGFSYAILIVVLASALVFRYFGNEKQADEPGRVPQLVTVEPVTDADSVNPLNPKGPEAGGTIQSKAVLP